MIVDEIGDVVWRIRHRIGNYRRNTTKQAAESAVDRAIDHCHETMEALDPDVFRERSQLGENRALIKADAALDRALNQLVKLQKILESMRKVTTPDLAILVAAVLLRQTTVLESKPAADIPGDTDDRDVIDAEFSPKPVKNKSLDRQP